MHESVLLHEVTDQVMTDSSGLYVDATLGGGGHSAALLQISTDIRLAGFDRDAEALARCRERFSERSDDIIWCHASFAEMERCLNERGIQAVDGIVMDLGLSSFQLADAERGFSFQSEGPLDMRMDTQTALTAAELVNSWSVKEMARLFRDCADERRAMPLARAIEQARERQPLQTTAELAAIAERVYGGRRGGIHPATRLFQALRMGVNSELEHLKQGLEQGIRLLKPGGRMAVISFHSIEDRCVKHIFREHEGKDVALQQGGSRWEGSEPRLRRINRKPILPGEQELAQNPRSRSAKLRVIERV